MLSRGRRWRPRDATVLAVLCVAFGVAFAPVLLGDRSFFHFDLYAEHIPVWHAVQAALLSGESPFWIDGQYAGTPLLYVQEAPLFYPLTVPLLLTGAAVHRLADVFSLLHFLLAGVLAARLVREETGDDGAAAIGGVAWMLSTRTVFCALWPNAVAVAALVPGLLVGLLRIGRGDRRSGVALSAVFGGLLGLTSRPQAVVGFLPAIVACAALALVRAPRWREAARDLVLSFFVAASLAAPSLATTAILHPEMERAAGLAREERNEAALDASTLSSVFLPADPVTRFPEAASHPGFLAWPLVLAATLFGRGRRDLLVALGVAGLAGLAFAFGEAGPWRLLSELPVLSGLRAPSRFLLSWSLFLAVGAALGASALARRFPRSRLLVPAALLLLVVDLSLHARASAPTAPAAYYRVVPHAARELAGRSPDASGFRPRYWSAGTTLPDARAPETTLAQFEAATLLPGATGLRWGLDALEGGGPTLSRTRRFLRSGYPHAARLAAVDIVIGPSGLTRVANPLPRAFAVPNALAAAGGDSLRLLLSPDFDATRSVVLEPPFEPARGDWTSAEASVRLVERRPGRLLLEAQLPGRGYLVLLEAFERGWSVAVDGAPAQLLPANVAFRAVLLGPGRHLVEMRYRPRGVVASLTIALLGLVLLVLRARARRDSRPDDPLS